MSQIVARVRECTDPACRFRYPIPDSAVDRPHCPLCGELARIAESSPTPGRPPGPHLPHSRPFPARSVAVLLDNIRSTYNVGAILRTADGAGIEHVHLAGITPHGDNPKVVKTALGAQAHVPWTHHRNGLDAVHALQAAGKQIWALDIYPTAMSLTHAVAAWAAVLDGGGRPTPVVLVVGNEITGIDPAIVALADRRVAIPMHGSKRSLNVAVAFGVAAYFLTQSPVQTPVP